MVGVIELLAARAGDAASSPSASASRPRSAIVVSVARKILGWRRLVSRKVGTAGALIEDKRKATEGRADMSVPGPTMWARPTP